VTAVRLAQAGPPNRPRASNPPPPEGVAKGLRNERDFALLCEMALYGADLRHTSPPQLGTTQNMVLPKHRVEITRQLRKELHLGWLTIQPPHHAARLTKPAPIFAKEEPGKLRRLTGCRSNMYTSPEQPGTPAPGCGHLEPFSSPRLPAPPATSGAGAAAGQHEGVRPLEPHMRMRMVSSHERPDPVVFLATKVSSDMWHLYFYDARSQARALYTAQGPPALPHAHFERISADPNKEKLEYFMASTGRSTSPPTRKQTAPYSSSSPNRGSHPPLTLPD